MTPSLSEVRRQVAAMPASEAVEYLLDLLSDTIGAEYGPVGDCRDFHLTPSELTLFRRLYRSEGNLVTHGSLMSALYIDRSDPPSENTMQVFLVSLRRKLPRGFAIESVWAQGYRLTRADGARFSWETRDPAAVGG